MIEMTEDDGCLVDKATRCKVTHLWIEQEMCKLYVWRTYLLPSQQSALVENMTVHRDDCFPTLEVEQWHHWTHQAMRENLENVIWAFLEYVQKGNQLSAYFQDNMDSPVGNSESN